MKIPSSWKPSRRNSSTSEYRDPRPHDDRVFLISSYAFSSYLRLAATSYRLSERLAQRPQHIRRRLLRVIRRLPARITPQLATELRHRHGAVRARLVTVRHVVQGLLDQRVVDRQRLQIGRASCREGV